MRTLPFILALLFSSCACGQHKSTRVYKSFDDFYDRITGKGLRFTGLTLMDTSTVLKKIKGDSIQSTYSLKIDQYRIKYISTRKIGDPDSYDDPGYILFNNKKILPDSTIGFEGLSILSASKAVLNGITFLDLRSWAPGCNGESCRAEYIELFQIKGKEVKYQMTLGTQSPEDIFCDLNHDGGLDWISFMGKHYSKNNSIETKNPDKYYFDIAALTLVNGAWVPLTGTNKKPYYIYLQADDLFDLDKFKIIDYNWPIKL
jgi:hypothetical protein